MSGCSAEKRFYGPSPRVVRNLNSQLRHRADHRRQRRRVARHLRIVEVGGQHRRPHEVRRHARQPERAVGAHKVDALPTLERVLLRDGRKLGDQLLDQRLRAVGAADVVKVVHADASRRVKRSDRRALGADAALAQRVPVRKGALRALVRLKPLVLALVGVAGAVGANLGDFGELLVALGRVDVLRLRFRGAVVQRPRRALVAMAHLRLAHARAESSGARCPMLDARCPMPDASTTIRKGATPPHTSKIGGQLQIVKVALYSQVRCRWPVFLCAALRYPDVSRRSRRSHPFRRRCGSARGGRPCPSSVAARARSGCRGASAAPHSVS